jgi:glycosyltransferase involved in cell wall biosynthesis
MRLALVVPGGVDRSGEYRVIPALLALIGRLALRHDVQVFALRQGAQADSWDLAGARVHNIGLPYTRLRTVHAIRSAHRSAPFDLVQAIWSGSCGLVAVTAAKMLGIPSFVHIGGGELVCLPDIGYGGSLRWRSRLREKLVLRAASVVTAASTPVIQALALLGVMGQRVPLGVDLHAWPPREPRRRSPGGCARLIHVASLNRVKDQTTLLRALAQLAKSGTRFEMDMVGEDTLGGEVQALAGQLGLCASLNFRGFVPQRELRALVAAADLMILSSRHEAGPIAMLEAAALGVPTIGTAVGHIVEWAPAAAICVPVGDWVALAHAMQALLGDEEQRLRIAHAALRRATDEDADYTARCFQALYADLIAGH